MHISSSDSMNIYIPFNIYELCLVFNRKKNILLSPTKRVNVVDSNMNMLIFHEIVINKVNLDLIKL